MTKGKFEEFDESSLIKEGNFAMIGAKMEKKPKLID